MHILKHYLNIIYTSVRFRVIRFNIGLLCTILRESLVSEGILQQMITERTYNWNLDFLFDREIQVRVGEEY